ncbi:hypothetical protein TWF481_002668 [Arthrobotrys musiformis]|uniref:Uncharacterized protein n=1 Tax=Arthrobotrys musiformis TaxID=47236 RepID=A0AAV9VQV5_9PEZI
MYSNTIPSSIDFVLPRIESYIKSAPQLKRLEITLENYTPEQRAFDWGEWIPKLHDSFVHPLPARNLKSFTLRVVDAEGTTPIVRALLAAITYSYGRSLKKLSLIGIPELKEILSNGIVNKLKFLDHLMVIAKEDLGWVTDIIGASPTIDLREEINIGALGPHRLGGLRSFNVKVLSISRQTCKPV